MFELANANAIADATRSDIALTNVLDRRTRKLFGEAIEKRHNLWLKIINSAERAKAQRAHLTPKDVGIRATRSL